MKEPAQKQPDFLHKQPDPFVIIITEKAGCFLDLNQLYHKLQMKGTEIVKTTIKLWKIDKKSAHRSLYADFLDLDIYQTKVAK